MMQTVLIPTNFSPSALDCIPNLCEQFKKEELNIIFVHLFKLSDSIGELLMLSRRSKEYELVNDDFYVGCNHIRNKYPQISAIKIEFLYGSTMAMFRNFLEANEVGYILEPENRFGSKINKSSIDPAVLIQKSGLPVIKLTNKAVQLKIASVLTVPQEELMEA